MYRRKQHLLLDLRVTARAFGGPPSHLGEQVGGTQPQEVPLWDTWPVSSFRYSFLSCPTSQAANDANLTPTGLLIAEMSLFFPLCSEYSPLVCKRAARPSGCEEISCIQLLRSHRCETRFRHPRHSKTFLFSWRRPALVDWDSRLRW